MVAADFKTLFSPFLMASNGSKLAPQIIANYYYQTFNEGLYQMFHSTTDFSFQHDFPILYAFWYVNNYQNSSKSKIKFYIRALIFACFESNWVWIDDVTPSTKFNSSMVDVKVVELKW